MRSARLDTAKSPALDGRVRRGERSREAIVAAMFELVGDGILQPTAQQVADHAGVGIRSVFRHFSDMETLYKAIDARLEADATRLLGAGERKGSLDQRIRGLVTSRAALFNRLTPYKRAGNLVRWRSPFLQSRHLHLQRVLRADLLSWLPELEQAPTDLVEAADLAVCFETWDHLRGDRALGQKITVAAMERILRALPLRLRPAPAHHRAARASA